MFNAIIFDGSEKDGKEYTIGNELLQGEHVCGRCGKIFKEHPAISRKDNMTEICPDCGTIEALEAWKNTKEKEGE